MSEPLDSTQIVGHTVVVVVSSQLGFRYFPKVLGLHHPGLFQPFLEGFQLGGKLLAGQK